MQLRKVSAAFNADEVWNMPGQLIRFNWSEVAPWEMVLFRDEENWFFQFSWTIVSVAFFPHVSTSLQNSNGCSSECVGDSCVFLVSTQAVNFVQRQHSHSYRSDLEPAQKNAWHVMGVQCLQSPLYIHLPTWVPNEWPGDPQISWSYRVNGHVSEVPHLESTWVKLGTSIIGSNSEK